MQRFLLTDFIARSSDKNEDEITLLKILPGLPHLSINGPWLAGGSLRRTLLGQEPDSDFDFFFKNSEQLDQFAKLCEKIGLEKTSDKDHYLQFEGIVSGSKLPVKVQAIRFAYYQSAEEVIDSFDFTICQFAYDGVSLICGDTALWDLGRKRLAVHKITFALSSMRRILKYSSQGFYACPGAMISLLKAIPENPSLLNQLSIKYVD